MKNQKHKKKLKSHFFCLQFLRIFREVIAADFMKFTKFCRKISNWRQKRQIGGRQEINMALHIYQFFEGTTPPKLNLINGLESG